MNREILLNAQSRQNQQAIHGFAVRSRISCKAVAWFAEENTAHTFAAMIRSNGAQCEVVPVMGTFVERKT